MTDDLDMRDTELGVGIDCNDEKADAKPTIKNKIAKAAVAATMGGAFLVASTGGGVNLSSKLSEQDINELVMADVPSGIIPHNHPWEDWEEDENIAAYGERKMKKEKKEKKPKK
jgi:hypothetical protein